jgi:predicted HNH restriction endonuclease
MKFNSKKVTTTTHTWEFTEKEIKAILMEYVRNSNGVKAEDSKTFSCEFNEYSEGGVKGVTVTQMIVKEEEGAES